ncbi:uncharacterized protein LOC110924648 [Helianthus annuus]|uniref:uncharacterized protein LOC110924648 n=1 Tax=Helianthus annuus TaxID=4232 RepID=UPI000B8FCCD8|nr:uncharacterized protein LOC110924648 [Helianthus annuus]
MVWADDENDEWVYYSDLNHQQKQSLLSEETIGNRSNLDVSASEGHNTCCKNREVKIMLSKKKLEELLEDLHNIPVDQMLDRLLDSSDRFELNYDHHEPWKPKLQSIPEES